MVGAPFRSAGAGGWEMATGALRVYFDGAGGPQQLGQTGSSVVRPRVRAREMRSRACGRPGSAQRSDAM